VKTVSRIGIGLLVAGSRAVAQSSSPEDIKATIKSILSDKMYQYKDQTDLKWDWSWLFKPLKRVLKYIDNMLSNAPPGLATVLYVVLIVIAVALLVHIILTFRKALRNRAEQEPVVIAEGPAPAAELAARGKQYAAEGNYVDASRLLYQAALTMLEERRKGRVRKGLTNSEYLHTFRSQWVIDQLRVFVELINWKWYRARTFDADDYARCLSAFETIESRLREES